VRHPFVYATQKNFLLAFAEKRREHTMAHPLRRDEGKPNRCPKCDKGFHATANLKRHLARKLSCDPASVQQRAEERKRRKVIYNRRSYCRRIGIPLPDLPSNTSSHTLNGDLGSRNDASHMESQIPLLRREGTDNELDNQDSLTTDDESQIPFLRNEETEDGLGIEGHLSAADEPQGSRKFLILDSERKVCGTISLFGLDSNEASACQLQFLQNKGIPLTHGE
jgi:hypothetical protein